MRVCSKHFERATKRRLLLDECPSLHFPLLPTSINGTQRKQPKERPSVVVLQDGISVVSECATDDALSRDASTQTENSSIVVEQELAAARERIATLELEVELYKVKLEKQKFRLARMVDDDGKVTFYT